MHGHSNTRFVVCELRSIVFGIMFCIKKCHWNYYWKGRKNQRTQQNLINLSKVFTGRLPMLLSNNYRFSLTDKLVKIDPHVRNVACRRLSSEKKKKKTTVPSQWNDLLTKCSCKFGEILSHRGFTGIVVSCVRLWELCVPKALPPLGFWFVMRCTYKKVCIYRLALQAEYSQLLMRTIHRQPSSTVPFGKKDRLWEGNVEKKCERSRSRSFK